MAAAIALMTVLPVSAQRMTDKLDRGLVAVKTDAGVFCSWRIQGEEYYDVTYNVYRDGKKLNAQPLTASNYLDASGTTGSQYTVSAVVRGVEQAKSPAAAVWQQNYMELKMDHGSLTSTYVPNDACMADVDGDGQLEILLKFDNASWAGTSYQKAGYNGEYAIIEVYKLNGKKLWWIDLGPNMADFQNNEQNIVAYDWDQDGKAEALMRAADGTTIHMADGTEYVVGDKSKNYLAATSSGQWFVHEGSEFLVYMNGETGKPYQVTDYPLKRLETGETNLEKAWGDGYGHRSTKHFFGAPYLDGRKPSIFLARGIYTRHKMIALDVNPTTHELTERWRWNCSDSSSPWYGNGYHNYAVADVDWDGRDEICFGSMVIDDNGKGLSTTGYGHGDAQHHGDFNPYIHGQEIFACLEDSPTWGNNYRDGTTSKVYYKFNSGHDDGRCIAGNFSNDYPGAMAFSGDDTPISCVTANHIAGMEKGNIPDNMRIYWDGDLCDEGFNYINGKNSAGGIYKYKQGCIETLTGSLTNNDTKGTPCYLGDILGDWREEVVMRTADNNIRIYTTGIPTEWRNYTLWHDMQYRNAMVWQMCGYNQPPHVSYFMGELEGITIAPPALTMTDRQEVADGGSIGSSLNDKQVILAETGNATVSVGDGAKPYIFFDNAPSWVQGHDDNNNITYTYYTHTLTGGAFAGDMRLVKQGDGTLVLPKVTQTYSGNTDVWAGTLNFDGTMQNSRVWLNRFAELNSNGGKFQKGIEMDYAAILRPGGKDKKGTVETETLTLNFGSRVVFDVYSDGTADQLKAKTLKVEKKVWENGPEYSTPVFEIAQQGTLSAGKILLGEIEKVEGNLSDVVLEGVTGVKVSLSLEGTKLYLVVAALRDATSVTWDGSKKDGLWDFAETDNMKLANGTNDVFVTGDVVTFSDAAANTAVVIGGEVSPAKALFSNSTKDYTLSGSGSIVGNTELVKEGTGSLTISATNKMTGGVTLKGGKTVVSALANNDGVANGALGAVSNKITFNGGTLAVTATTTSSQAFVLGANGGTVEVAKGATLTQTTGITRSSSTVKSALHKSGNGTLIMPTGNQFSALYVDDGKVNIMENNAVMSVPDTIVFNGKDVIVDDIDDWYSYSKNSVNYKVTEGSVGSLYLDGRCEYNGRLYGKGTLNVYARYVRNDLKGDWSAFEGTVVATHSGSNYEFRWFNTYGLPKATLNIASGTTFTAENRNVALGNLAGSGVLSTSGTVTVGSTNEDIIFGGSFANSAKVVKVGTGAWKFSKAVSGANSFTIKEGEARLDNSTATPLFGTTLVTVQDKGEMTGVGTVSAVAVQTGGTLKPGSATSTRRYGAITSNGSVKMYAGSSLNLIAYGKQNNNTSRSYLIVGGELALNGEINIELGSNYTPASGDEIIFWTAGSVSGKPTAINLPALPAGLLWDTTDLLKAEGKLKVTGQTGISAVSLDEAEGQWYDLSGHKLGATPTEKGVYIKNGKKIIIK